MRRYEPPRILMFQFPDGGEKIQMVFRGEIIEIRRGLAVRYGRSPEVEIQRQDQQYDQYRRGDQKQFSHFSRSFRIVMSLTPFGIDIGGNVFRANHFIIDKVNVFVFRQIAQQRNIVGQASTAFQTFQKTVICLVDSEFRSGGNIYKYSPVKLAVPVKFQCSLFSQFRKDFPDVRFILLDRFQNGPFFIIIPYERPDTVYQNMFFRSLVSMTDLEEWILGRDLDIGAPAQKRHTRRKQ